jgi:hypothetical protein
VRAQALIPPDERAQTALVEPCARIAGRKAFALMDDIWQPDAVRSFPIHQRSAFRQEVIPANEERQLLLRAV